MPILKREIDLFPPTLLDEGEAKLPVSRIWWLVYTRSRREKELMRKLRRLEIPFYGPLVENRFRSPAGRDRVSYLPLFSNYVFIYGTPDERLLAFSTNCVNTCTAVENQTTLTQNLRDLHRLIHSGRPVTLEQKVQPGSKVEIKSGSLKGVVGIVLERKSNRRLLVSVELLQQGASVELDDHIISPVH